MLPAAGWEPALVQEPWAEFLCPHPGPGKAEQAVLIYLLLYSGTQRVGIVLKVNCFKGDATRGINGELLEMRLGFLGVFLKAIFSWNFRHAALLKN